MHCIELESAGCVVLQGGWPEVEVLLIWTLRHAEPNLPKGKIEQGEIPMECAIREVREETGYNVRIVHPQAIRVETYLTKFPPPIHKIIEFYLAETLNGSPDQREEKRLVTKVAWCPAREALQNIRRAEEQEALKKCLDLARYINEGYSHRNLRKRKSSGRPS